MPLLHPTTSSPLFFCKLVDEKQKPSALLHALKIEGDSSRPLFVSAVTIFWADIQINTFAYAVMHGLWRSATEKSGCAREQGDASPKSGKDVRSDMPHRSADSLTVAQFIMHSMYFIHISRGLRVPE